MVAASDSAQEYRSISDFSCDGTDDHVQINLALAASDNIVLAPGTYSISNANTGLTVDSGDHVNGYGAIIQFAASSDAVVKGFTGTNVTDVTIEGVTIDGNMSNQTGTGNFHYGMNFITTCHRIRILNCRIYNVGNADAQSGYGIYFNDVEQGIIEGCYFSGNKREDTVFYNGSNQCTLSLCTSYSAADRSYVLHDSDHCTISACKSVSPGVNGLDISNSDYCVIDTCTIYQSGGIAIDVADTVGLQIGDTKVYDPTGYGVAIGTDCDYASIDNCTIYSSASRAIYITAADYTRITDCTIYDNEAGIYVSGPYTSVSGCLLLNNGGAGSGTDNGITVGSSGDNSFLADNYFASGTDQVYGIRILSGGDNCYIKDNYLVGAGTSANLNDAAAGTRYEGNLGYFDRAKTIAADDTTPDVSSGNIFITSANSGATTITDLSNPYVGQIITIIGGSNTSSSTIADSGNFNLSAAWTASLDDVLVLYVQADNDYIELSRVDN
jgi:parallel beta-helix repeat protein